MTFKIYALTLSQNVFDRLHWTAKSNEKDRWYWLVLEAVGSRRSKERRAAHLTITRVAPRLIDDSNLPSGQKYLIDALCYYNVLKSDRHGDLTNEYRQRKCVKGESPHMEIEILYEHE